jgi:hypothetical protein
LPADSDKEEEKLPTGQGWGKSYPQDRYKSYPQERCKSYPLIIYQGSLPGEPRPLVGRWLGEQTRWQTVSHTYAEVIAMRAPSFRRVRLIGVVSAGELAECLRRVGQDEWCTRVRLGGLLLLIDFLCRHRRFSGIG